jgi:hypothetical protein
VKPVEGAETRAPTPFLLDTQFSNASSVDLSKVLISIV